MCRMYKCSNSCLCCSCWWNLDFSFKSYGKESLYKYCMNVDDGRIMRSWRSCLFMFSFNRIFFFWFLTFSAFIFSNGFDLVHIISLIKVSTEATNDRPKMIKKKYDLCVHFPFLHVILRQICCSSYCFWGNQRGPTSKMLNFCFKSDFKGLFFL